MSLKIEILDQLPSRARHSRTSTRVTEGPIQRRQSSALEASLVSSHSACGTAKSSRHIALIRQALFHKVHHDIGLGHVIAQGVLCQHDPAGNHHSMANALGAALVLARPAVANWWISNREGSVSGGYSDHPLIRLACDRDSGVPYHWFQLLALLFSLFFP
jgi:hypothetical protein